MRRKTTENSGFTLIELLICVAILAAVSAPLLHSFATSAKVAAAAKETSDATAAVTNIAETVEATELENLLLRCTSTDRGIAFSGNEDAVVKVTDPASGTERELVSSDDFGSFDRFQILIDGYEYQGASYDAQVVLDAGAYTEVNQKKITQYSSMDNSYVQPVGTENPDWQAAVALANSASVQLGVDYSPAVMLGKLTRTITLTIDKDAAENALKMKLEFRYTADGVDDGAGGSLILEPVENVVEFFNKGFGTSEMGKQTVYFFFQPFYGQDGENNDYIEIKNLYDVDMDLFLVKQRSYYATEEAGVYTLTQYAEAAPELAARENSYKASVTLRESSSLSITQEHCKIYTNMAKDITKTDQALPIGSCAFRLIAGVWSKQLTPSGELVSRDAVNRLFGMTVTLSDQSGDEIASFDGSIMS